MSLIYYIGKIDLHENLDFRLSNVSDQSRANNALKMSYLMTTIIKKKVTSMNYGAYKIRMYMLYLIPVYFRIMMDTILCQRELMFILLTIYKFYNVL